MTSMIPTRRRRNPGQGLRSGPLAWLVMASLALLPACAEEEGSAGDSQAQPGDARTLDAADVGDAATDAGATGDAAADAGLIPLLGPHAQVIVPVANIRNQPVAATPGSYAIDMKQETQALHGDVLSIVQEQGGWLKVTLPSQLFFDKSASVFGPYPGWIQKKYTTKISAHAPLDLVVSAQETSLRVAADSASKLIARLSVGTTLPSSGVAAAGFREVRLPGGGSGWVAAADVTALKAGSPTVSRQAVITRAARFLGATYLWGGYSAPFGPGHAATSTGVDCSGLVGLVYRSFGLKLPRNSGDQHRDAQQISIGNLTRGDLIFVSSDGSSSGIYHVMIYDSAEKFIESTNAGAGVVRWSTFQASFGLTHQQLVQSNGKVSTSRRLLAARVTGVKWVK